MVNILCIALIKAPLLHQENLMNTTEPWFYIAFAFFAVAPETFHLFAHVLIWGSELEKMLGRNVCEKVELFPMLQQNTLVKPSIQYTIDVVMRLHRNLHFLTHKTFVVIFCVKNVSVY